MTETAPYSGWAILELLGHRRLAGHVTEQTIAGAGFFRIDVPAPDGDTAATQFYPPSSVYCLTPVSEDVARSAARWHQVQPVHEWELHELHDGRAVVDADVGFDEEG
jgi:hypothetical protein